MPDPDEPDEPEPDEPEPDDWFGYFMGPNTPMRYGRRRRMEDGAWNYED
jgi:hypothetical protein